MLIVDVKAIIADNSFNFLRSQQMKSFDRWLDDFFEGMSTTPPQPEPIIPDGVYDVNGIYMVDCCVCGKSDEVPVDLCELPTDGYYDHYCGGSPRCCP